MDIWSFFEPLIACMQFLGFLILENETDSRLLSEKVRILILKGVRTVYLSLMWLWTICMSINIFWLSIAETNEDGVSPMDGQRANMIITLLNEAPYAVITIRNAVVLSLFVANGPKLLTAIQWCEDLCGRMNISMRQYSARPLQIITASVVVIVLWETHEWNVWFTTYGIMYQWNFAPFQFSLIHYFYAMLWWTFTSVPFIFAQLSLIFPILFALVIRKYLEVINKELEYLASAASLDIGPELLRAGLAQRLTTLRKWHFGVLELIVKIDKLIRAMLLWQFLLDMVVLFGFLGLLLNSKDTKPPMKTIEWTFFIPSSLIWFCFFLFCFNIPLIKMANEGEKTHHVVHALTISSDWLHQEKYRDMQAFLDETKHASTAFTGGNFYYVNRHYIVTCFAVVASEIMVLAEVLDRFYGTLDIRIEVKHLRKILEDYINTTASNATAYQALFQNHTD